jgi:hypothetical protein
MFRRGFKTWAEQTSTRVRQRLKLPASAPLNPLALAELLGVQVVTPGELEELDGACAARLCLDHAENWSAITVSDGEAHLIVMNPAHPNQELTATSRTNWLTSSSAMSHR